MSSATEPPSFNKAALAVAWLTLAAALAGLGGYLAVARQSGLPGSYSSPYSLAEEAMADSSALSRSTAEPASPEADGPASERAGDDLPAARSADAASEETTADAPAPARPASPEQQTGEAEGQSMPSAHASQTSVPPTTPPPADGEQADLRTAESGAAAAGASDPPPPAAAQPSDQGGGPESKPQWRQFATAVEVDGSRPRIAVVVSGLGLSSAATEAAIKHLPAYVTLSFSPYARRLNQWIALARVNGHEVMLDLPMEPVGYPNLDPGPHALLTSLDVDQNLERLSWILRRGTSYVGVAAMMGSRFTASEDHLYPVMKELNQRGLLFLDNRAISSTATPAISQQLGMPLLINDRAIDEAQASRIAIDSRLAQIERLALTNGTAVAMGQPFPVTIERLRDWTALLGARGFTLVPITALVPEPTSG